MTLQLPPQPERPIQSVDFSEQQCYLSALAAWERVCGKIIEAVKSHRCSYECDACEECMRTYEEPYYP